MKKSDLQIGRTYADGKGNLRRILAIIPEYTLLAYAIVRGRRTSWDEGKTPAGEQIRRSTVASFASWAKSEHP